MKTDCPRCSWLCETTGGDFKTADCPFCGLKFKVLKSPFQQLKQYLEQLYPDRCHSPFHNPDYATTMPCKSFSGWIIRRIKDGESEDVVKLLSEFIEPDLAEMQVKTLWDYDFRPYFTAPKDVYIQIRALWLLSCIHEMSVAMLLSVNLWTSPVQLTDKYMKVALKRIKSQQIEDGIDMHDGPITLDDLIISTPQGNPIFDWASQAPLAIRHRLLRALMYCRHGCSSEITYDHLIELDQATYYDDRLAGVDYLYATRILMESNIFCLPEIQDYEKIFSKDDYFNMLTECNIQTKKGYTRKQMLKMIVDLQGGEAWLRAKTNERKYVRLHPTLERYANEIDEYHSRSYHLWRAVSLIGAALN